MIAQRAHVPGGPTGFTWLARLTRSGALRATWPSLLPLIVLAPALWVIVVWHFNGLYGQDPFAYFDYGVGPLRGFLLHGTPPTAFFWPLGYPILIALVSLLLGPVVAAGQIVNVAAGGAAVLLTYLVGRDLLLQAGAQSWFACRAGAVAALLLGATGRLLEASVLIMADAVALAASLLSAWALLRWAEPGAAPAARMRWGAVAAAALAWSTVTRWGGALLLPVWLIAVLPVLQEPHEPRLPWRAMPLVLLPAAAILAAQAWLIATVPPAPDLGPLPFAGDLTHLNGIDSSWSWSHLWQHRFTNADGTLTYSTPNYRFYGLGAFLPQYLTPLAAPAVVAGLIIALRRYRRALFLLLPWPTFLLTFDAGLGQQNPRYILAALPPIALLAGIGAAAAWERLGRRGRLPALGLACVCLLAVQVSGMTEVTTLNRLRLNDLQVADWVARSVPPDSTVLSFGLTLTLQHATGLQVTDLSTLTGQQVKQLAHSAVPVYLLVQDSVMQRQVAALVTGRNYGLLRAQPGLVWLGALHGYTLSRLARVSASIAPRAPDPLPVLPTARRRP